MVITTYGIIGDYSHILFYFALLCFANTLCFRYYDRLLLEKEYKLDAQKIAEYFPLTHTINGMLKIFESLFGLEFVEVTDESKNVWHEDCKQFRVYNEKPSDGSEQTFVGWLYLDLHPRDGKYGHAANFNLQPVKKKFHFRPDPNLLLTVKPGIHWQERGTPLSSYCSSVQLLKANTHKTITAQA
jgi:Peptidase family M3